ncbi:MAG: transcriptional repressor LexA [Candidatus Peregrinibacteria bacterium]|nr:transcriptional repressor LexA [Candidatus Peregrinibacteria bacterium]
MDQVLTEKQEAVLKFIEEYQLAYGKSPTLKEMREHFGVSSDNSILKHLTALKEKGYIQKDDTPRGIGLLNSVKEKLDEGAFSLPILGFVPAGGPVVTDEYVEGWMKVGEELAKNNTDYFFLKVTGISMIDAGIFEGDLVLVNTKKEPKAEDIVVALIDEGNTLKRLVRTNGKYYLKAENKDYKDIYPKESLTIQGVVTGMIRQY